ncbi:STAS domain-containing protein [Desulfobacula phenolica]|uniref:RsbT antagonist protein RsbS n=1 Tax=Desulfobacula phenolica TaxID=90732 RepID=A0A1H2E281_9BACT|nr:STAS domain-containing protein [Desulfobacula phenolica]SDT89282.1 rsbT antagonist protein RsbS [Desulfobacula phenolica]
MATSPVNDRSVISDSGMYVVEGCLIVPVSADTDSENINCLGKKILTQVKATQAKGVIVNVSGVRVMDSYTFSMLINSARANAMVGAMTIFVGFQPGVASSLVDLDVELGDLLTAVTMEDAFDLLRKRTCGLGKKIVTDMDNHEVNFEGNWEKDGYKYG